MLKITTESGAVYFDDGKRVMRAEGEMNPDMWVPNNEWHEVVAPPSWVVGESTVMTFVEDVRRITTPVVSVERLPDGGGSSVNSFGEQYHKYMKWRNTLQDTPEEWERRVQVEKDAQFYRDNEAKIILGLSLVGTIVHHLQKGLPLADAIDWIKFDVAEYDFSPFIRSDDDS